MVGSGGFLLGEHANRSVAAPGVGDCYGRGACRVKRRSVYMRRKKSIATSRYRFATTDEPHRSDNVMG
jgi:hypothetical protein